MSDLITRYGPGFTAAELDALEFAQEVKDLREMVAELEAERDAWANTGRWADKQRLAAEAKVEELEAWIEQEGERGDICTFNILRKVCSYCQCKRKKEQGDES
jgi:hypothetical protein